LDEKILAEEGRPIAEIFRADGEGAFRELESASLDRWTGGGRLVLSTGGGCVLASGNRDLLKERCTVIWLDLSPELAATRAGRGSQTPAVRPLLADGDIVERMRILDAIRRPLYRECADIVIQVGDKSPAAIVEELYAALD
jgi:shikimate kinase